MEEEIRNSEGQMLLGVKSKWSYAKKPDSSSERHFYLVGNIQLRLMNYDWTFTKPSTVFNKKNPE